MKKHVIQKWPIWAVLLFILAAGTAGIFVHHNPVDAAANQVIGLQLRDDSCNSHSGTQRYAADVGVWSNPWAGDSDDYDPDCMQIYLGNTIPKDTDIRIGIQARDINTPCGFLWLFKCGDGGGTVVYGPWISASVGSSYSNTWTSWASDADAWDPDQWRFIVDSQPRYGYSVTDFKMGLQLGDVAASSGGCTGQIGAAKYTASSTQIGTGGWTGWSGWAGDDSDNQNFNCARINLVATTTLDDPTATLTGTSTVPYGDSVNIPWDVEYINSCTLTGYLVSDNSVVDPAYTILAHGTGSKTSVAITAPVRYTLLCNGTKSGTTATASITLSTIAQPASLAFSMNPTSGLSAGGTSVATISAVNASSCTLVGKDISGTTVDAGYTFTPPPPSAIVAPPTVTDTIYLTTGTTYTVPANWNSSNNSIEVVGGGGGGKTNSRGGAGGGAYSKITNLALTPGAPVTYAVGVGGAASAAGGDTWFNAASMAACATAGPTACVGAKGGAAGVLNAGGVGGGAASGVGTLKYSGGNGYGSANTSGGGGGAAGPSGNGGTGGGESPGTHGGTGGGGANGGASGGRNSSNTGTAGGNGITGTGGGAGGTSSTPDGGWGSAGGGGGGGNSWTTIMFGPQAGTIIPGGVGGNGSGSYVFCANEGGTCTFTGTKTIFYTTAAGVSNSGVYTSSVSCSNAVFGDPSPGDAKYCLVVAPNSAVWGTNYGPGGGGGGAGPSQTTGVAGGLGGLYGGGGGGGSGTAGVGGTGGAGIIIIKNTHTTQVGPIYLTSGTSWTVPKDWSSSNSIEVIGGGGGGVRVGGGGGAYSKASNVSLTQGATVTISVGAGGAGSGGSGGDTYVCNNTSNCASIAGTAVVAGAKGGAGGSTTGAAAASGVGSVKYSGGGGGSSSNGGSGGGGAGGPLGNGAKGGNTSVDESSGGGGNGGGGAGGNPPSCCFTDHLGGNGGDNAQGNGGGDGGDSSSGDAGTNGGGGGGSDNSSSYRGGNGGNGIEWDATHGSGGGGGGGDNGVGGNGGLYGGGGGGKSSNTGAAGGQGIIVIKYFPGNSVADNTDAHTSSHIVNVTTDYTVTCTPYDNSANVSQTVRVTLNACLLDGVPIANNGSANFYSQSTPPAGHTCSEYGPAVRGCTNGQLTGNAAYKYASCLDQGSVTITANGVSPSVAVRKGSTVALAWDGGNADTCTVTGTDGFNGANSDGTTDTSGGRSVTVSQKTVYTARCTLGNSTKQSTVTVNIIPTVQEN